MRNYDASLQITVRQFGGGNIAYTRVSRYTDLQELSGAYNDLVGFEFAIVICNSLLSFFLMINIKMFNK